jgi:prepilin-type N-terminal cleavage/methylation domain
MSTRRRKLGFTLAELLVVVAIIAILVGVSIPIFSAQTKKAKIATVRANIRSARAAAYSEYLTSGFKSTSNTYGYYVYDIKNGTVTLYGSYNMGSNNWPNLDGKNSAYRNSTDPTATADYKYNYIYVYIKIASSEVEIKKDKADIQTCPYYDETKDDIVYNPGTDYGN